MRSVGAGEGKIAAGPRASKNESGPEHSIHSGPREQEPFPASSDTECFRCRPSADFETITKFGLSQSSC